MPFGYTGQNQPNQTVSNSGVFSITDVAELQSQGKLGGSLELISTTTFSSVSEVDITSGFTGYDVFQVQVTKLVGSTAPQNFRFRFYESGVLETASVYQYAMQYLQVDGGNGEERSTTSDSCRAFSFNSNDYAGAYFYLYNLSDSSKYSFYTFQNAPSYDGDYEMKFGGGVLPQASVVDGVRFYPSTGTFSGEIKIYGVKQI